MSYQSSEYSTGPRPVDNGAVEVIDNSDSPSSSFIRLPKGWKEISVVFACFGFVGLVLYTNMNGQTISTASIKAQLATTGFVKFSSLDAESKAYLFEGFQSQFGKYYSDEDERATKFKNFENFLTLADERNHAERAAGGTAVHGITKFADWSEEEFKSLLGYKASNTHSKMKKARKEFSASAAMHKAAEGSTSVDWSDVYTTPIKNQGYCGSCWAFSATSQIESDSIRAGYLTTTDELSPQQIVSCDTVDYGCDGGNTETAYYYVYEAGGIQSNQSYPYTSYWDVTGTCMDNSADFLVTVDDYYYFTATSASVKEKDMISYVKTTGPLSVCLDAASWSSYTSGIVKHCGHSVDHCVQAVGINTEREAWKVRNSWGTDWGDNGYIYLSAGDNTCYITYDPTYVETSPV